jgi:hypothetical protein
MAVARGAVTKIGSNPCPSEAEWTRGSSWRPAIAYARYRMTDHIYTHISARDRGATDQFLLNPYGLEDLVLKAARSRAPPVA